MTNTRPPSASRAGINRHYHDCGPTDSRRHYGICLFTLEAHERGQQLMETPCVKAIEDGSCPALAMREQERQAGHAIFFKAADPEKAVSPKAAQRERQTINTKHPSYQRGRHGEVWGSKESRQKAQAKARVAQAMPSRPKPGDMLEFNGADIVNAAMGEPRTAKTIKAEMVELSKPAAQRRRESLQRGEREKPSVVHYMTNDERQQLATLRRELQTVEMTGVTRRRGETPLEFARRKQQEVVRHG